MRYVLVALLLGACQGFPAVEYPKPERAVPWMIEHSVLLKDPGCTGIRIGAGRMLTAKHCIDGRYKVGEDYSGYRITYVSPSHDFVVMAEDKLAPPVRMRNAVVGEPVYIVGYPVSLLTGDQNLTVTDGIFTGVFEEDAERTTAWSYGGNSGGGVWAADGDLVGILVFGVVHTDALDEKYTYPAHAYMVPIRDVVEVLSDQP